MSHSGISKLQNFKVQNFEKRAITKKISYEFFSIFIKYSIHHSLAADTSYNTFQDMAFTKFHPFVCQWAIILQGEIIQGKPKIRVSYFSMRNPYMKFQDDISNLHTYIHTHTHTRTSRNQYVPHFFKVGGIKMYTPVNPSFTI